MVGKDYAQLVTVSKAQYDAAKIEAHLRKSGQPVRMQALTPGDDLPDRLRQFTPDLVFCDGQDPKLDVDQVVRTCQQVLPGVPVLLLVETLDGDRLTQALKSRARDCVSPRHLEHLQFVFMRELGVHHLTRQLSEAEREVAVLSNQVEGLISTSQDAVAYLQEGIIVEVNPAFAKCFGLDDPLAMAGEPLMDLIGADDQAQVKRALSRVSKGKEAEHSLRCHGSRDPGAAFEMELRVRTAQFNGEDCLEVLIVPLQPIVTAPAAASAGADLQVVTNGLPEHDPRFALYRQITEARHYQDHPPVTLYYVIIDDMPGLEKRIGFIPAFKVSLVLHDLFRTAAPGVEIFRFSSSEFVCTLQDVGLSSAVELSQRLCKNAQEQVFQAESVSALLTVSIGVTQVVSADQAESRFWEARAAARELSTKGGNQVKSLVTEAETAQAPVVDPTWLSRLQNGIAQNRFQLNFRNVASLEGDQREYFDALPYLQDDGDKKHSPEEYQPWAEKAHLSAQIESRVLGQALAALAQRAREGRQQGLFVPLSSASLENAEPLGSWLGQQAAAGTLNGQELVLMFNEKALIYHVSQANSLLQHVAGMPVSMAVDGLAGTTASAKLLQHVAVRFVRLSPTASKALINNKDKLHQQVQECMTAARNHGCKIVSAGTADAHSMAMLWQVGVNYVVTGS
ncbi:MAG: EAL domain-containing protein [Nevskiales bacterium]